MNLLPELNKSLENLSNVNIEALKEAAEKLEDAGLSKESEALWDKVFQVQDEWQDTMLAIQEIKDGGY